MKSTSAYYNDLRSVEVAHAELQAQPGVLAKLARHLVEYDLHHTYDIRLIHKHYNIAAEERVVTFDGEGYKISVPCSSGQISAEVLEEHGIVVDAASGSVLPSDYIIDGSDMVPYEFSFGPKAPIDAEVDSSFLGKWNTTLNSHGMNSLLGLAVQDATEIGGFEESDSQARWSRVAYGALAPAENTPGYLTTSWRVANSGSGLIELKQCSYCTSLQKHGKSTSCTS